VSCKFFAEEIAREFQMKGYFVYYGLMGYGSSRIPQGTPVVIRIKTKPKCSNSNLVEFY
jgi:PII-like signaling protein